jgi:hypothetical protein
MFFKRVRKFSDEVTVLLGDLDSLLDHAQGFLDDLRKEMLCGQHSAHSTGA